MIAQNGEGAINLLRQHGASEFVWKGHGGKRDELIGTGNITEENVAAHVLERTHDASSPHVFTLHAELEGGRLAGVFEQLLSGWKAQGWRIGPLRTLRESVEPMALPRCENAMAPIAGRSGTVLMQGDEFLGDVDDARR